MLIFHPVNCYLPMFLLECLQAHHVFHWKKAWMTQLKLNRASAMASNASISSSKSMTYTPPEVEQRFCHRKVTNFSPISEAGSSSFPTIFQGRAVKLREGNQSKIDSNDSTLHDFLGRCLVRNCVFCCFFWGGMELVESPDT